MIKIQHVYVFTTSKGDLFRKVIWLQIERFIKLNIYFGFVLISVKLSIEYFQFKLGNWMCNFRLFIFVTD